MKAGANIFEEVLKKLKENPDSFTLREALTLAQYAQLEVIIFLSSLLLSGTPEALERFCRNAPHLHNLLTQSESILQELKSLHLQLSDTQEVLPSDSDKSVFTSTDVCDRSPLEAGRGKPASPFKEENPDKTQLQISLRPSEKTFYSSYLEGRKQRQKSTEQPSKNPEKEE